MELATPATRALTDPLGAWALKRIRLDGIPFSFEGHEYLRAIYDDTAPHVVLSKAAQIGGTTYGILRSLHACLQGLNVIYYFPTRTDVLDFSRSRVGPLLADNPFLAQRMTDTDTVGLKRIGDAHLYFRGMKSTVGMKSVPADMIVFDELDEASPDARALAWERIAHSDYKRIIELSNPSLSGYGIDEQYEKSDQRHWTLKCPSCGEWTALEREFPVKLGQEVKIILPRDDGTYYRACPKCGAELDLDQGEWVADYPERPIHGYRVSQLFSSKVDPGEILEEYRATRFPERFYNLKIGIPWADLERRLDVPTVLALCRDGEAPLGIHVMGVDTGKHLHVLVLRTNGYERWPGHVVHLQICATFEELHELMRRFRIQRCVIDGMPETHSTRDFARHYRESTYGNVVFLNFFNENQHGSARWDEDGMKVDINRTEALDASRAAIREKRMTLPPPSPVVEEFARHMASDAKVLEEDEDTGAKRYRYVRTGEDHFSLAFTYGLMALESLDFVTPEEWAALHQAFFRR
jgi:hypothetical protein